MASEFENLFGRLPTELIISILGKISDVKCLSVCCSVSKLFAALVPRTRLVSFEIPSTIGHAWREFGEVLPRGKMNFMKKLRCVECVAIRFSICDPNIEQRYSGSLVRWKSDSSSFVLVAAENRVDEDPRVDPSRGKVMTDAYYYAVFYSIRNHLYHYTMRGVYIKELLRVFPNLKKVCAVESSEQGSFVWEEDIDGMKRDVRAPWEDKDVFCVKLWSVPLVKLPVSRCAMEDVTLISIREIEGYLHGFMEDNPFEETEYRELAMITMNQPQLVDPFSLPFYNMFDVASNILQYLQFLRH